MLFKYLFFLLLVRSSFNVIYRTKWPFYTPKESYSDPVQPIDLCNARICPANKPHLTCNKMFVSNLDTRFLNKLNNLFNNSSGVPDAVKGMRESG